MTPILPFLLGFQVGASLIAVLPYRWGNRLLCAVLASLVAFAFVGRVFGASLGAPIPARPGGYYPPPAARNNCLETYKRSKQLRCDRPFSSGFEPQGAN
jgi:hypothetical protein